MNKLYLNPAGKFFLHAITAIALIILQFKPIPINAQGLVFKDPVLQTGQAKADGAVSMYAFWFKSFSYQTPVQNKLPVIVSSFTAKKTNSTVLLNWSTEVEKNTSHFVVERSNNGTDFTDAGVIFTDGDADKHREYRFADDFKSIANTILYYRLKIVDLNGSYKQSAVRIIRVTDNKDAAARMIVYPNPVVNDVRITLPESWLDQPVTIQVINSNGTEVKKVEMLRAGQTEIFVIGNLPAGLYVIKASKGTEVAVQQLIKAR